MPPIFSFQLKTTFPKIRKKSWRKRNVFTPLLTVGMNSWGLFENMWGFLFVMIRLLDVVAVVMEKDGGCWWCFVCFSEDMKPRLNSGRTDGNVSLCSSKTLRCYFQVTECLSIFLFFSLCLFWVCLHIAKTNQEMVSHKLSRCARWHSTHSKSPST